MSEPQEVRIPTSAPSGASIRMVVLNADGTVKSDLGLVTAGSNNPVKNLWHRLVTNPLGARRIRKHNRRPEYQGARQ